MSGKLLHSFTDENQDLQKQIGCMNGLIRLLDRHQFLSGRRERGGNHKRLPAGQSASQGMQPNSLTKKTMEENRREEKEKQRVSVESSWTSFSSSSCSSTFSSVDGNKTALTEPSFSCQSIFPETPSRILPVKQPDSSLHLGQQSLALRNVVPDSMYREARGVSVKTLATEEGRVHVMKHIDSPRATNFNGSVRVVPNVREAPWKERKDGSLPFALRENPRFSYDERETRDVFKSTIKLKDLPRLSLDSRAGTIRSSASELRSNYFLRDPQRENGNSSHIPNILEEPGSNKQPSSVVAKLMGLEAFPDSTTNNHGQMMKIKPCSNEYCGKVSKSSKTAFESKQDQVLGSPKISPRDSASPRLRNANPVIKPASSTRVPLEPAPWRQLEGGQGFQKPAFKCRESSVVASNASHSVYGEIEKRLTELEFKRSGKDLRALKQILEAMQKTRERLDNKREDQTSDSESQTSKFSQNYSSFDQISKFGRQQSRHSSYPVSPTTKATSPPTRFKSQFMARKPAAQNEKPRITGSSLLAKDGISGLRKLRTGKSVNTRDFHDKQTNKDLTPRNNNLRQPSSRPHLAMDKKSPARTLRSHQISMAPENEAGECFTSPGRNFGTVSPRLLQKKQGMEKQSRPTTPLSELSTSRRQLKQLDSASTRRKSKSASLHKEDAQSSDIGSETRKLSHQGDTVSEQSESNTSLASQIETEITSKYRYNENNGVFHPDDAKDRIFAARSSEDKFVAELKIVTLEQPSPVSVLDAMFYREEPPSPVNKISSAFKDAKTSNLDESEWHPEDLGHIQKRKAPNLICDFSSKKLERIERLIHKLERLNTSDETTTDHIVALCESTNPDHRYISEILLASGLLKDLGSSSTAIQLQQSGHVINPNLFHVLEQTKQSTELSDENHHGKLAESKFSPKIQRKQIFDIVNEILSTKLAFQGSYKLGGRSLSAQKLLKELCSEIDNLQAHPECGLVEDDGLSSIFHADMSRRSEDWTNYHVEIPGLVLDIERLIFKDLISEIVRGEADNGQDHARKHCRQLFTNH